MVWILVPVAYLFGSLSSAVIVSRAFGLPDPREQGSKNPGATNVLRLGGRKAAILTLLGDTAKGLVPLLIARAWGAGDEALGLIGLAAFVGHLFPVFFRFRGGKGVATALGVLLGFSWAVGGFAALTWLAVFGVTRISSVGGLTAAALAPLYVWGWLGSPWLTASTAVMTALLFWRHRGNIVRLVRGEEGRIVR